MFPAKAECRVAQYGLSTIASKHLFNKYFVESPGNVTPEREPTSLKTTSLKP